MSVKKAKPLLVEGYSKILEAFSELGYDVKGDPNFTDTHTRAAKGLEEIVWPRSKIERELKKILKVSFPVKPRTHILPMKDCGHDHSEDHDHDHDHRHIGDMVFCHDKVIFSLCPHHLLPVSGVVQVAYIPEDGRVLGLSKLARIPDIIARQPILQEDFVAEVADVLFYGIDSGGSAVVCNAIHHCMACRGIRAHETSITVAAMRGAFDKNAATRKEFYDVLKQPRTNLLSTR